MRGKCDGGKELSLPAAQSSLKVEEAKECRKEGNTKVILTVQ